MTDNGWPLDGVRVLEIGDGLAAPLASRLLGDVGADVVKLEAGEGDRVRRSGPMYTSADGRCQSALFGYLNWNKRSVLADPAEDRDRIETELAAAEILIVGDYFDMIPAWSLDLDHLQSRFKNLIVVCVTPYGLGGPKRSWRSSDLTLQAASGLLSICGTRDREPVRRGLRQCTYEAGLNAAYAALSALYHVRKGGQAPLIDLSIAECLTSELVLTMPEYTFAGAVPTRRPPVQDVLTTGEPVIARGGLAAMQITVTVGADRYAAFLSAPQLSEERFATAADRRRHAAELVSVLETALRNVDVSEFFVRSAQQGLLTGIVQTSRQLLRCPQLRARQAFITMPGQLHGSPWRMPSGPIALPGPRLRQAAPGLGQHTGELPPPPRPVSPPAQGPAGNGPLAGLRVLDLSTLFAAPYMCGLLADLGAQVIKIEAPNRLDQTRVSGFGPPYLDNQPRDDGWDWCGTFHSVNRGKQSLVLNLKDEDGRAVLRRLIAQSDILVENFTPQVMKGWGLSYDTLNKLNSRLIMVSNTGYGHTGPWANFKAQGTTLEATMGLTYHNGYAGGKPRKVGQSYPDFLAAWSGLYAIHALLLRRLSSGSGGWIDLGMYQLGSVVIPEALIAEQAGNEVSGPQGNSEPGALLSGVFACAGDDNWVAVSLASAGDLTAAEHLLGLETPGREGCADRLPLIWKALRAWATAQDAPKAAQELQEHGIAAEAVASVRDVLLDSQYRERRFFEWVRMRSDDRPLIGRPYRWRGDARPRVRKRAPCFGEHNDIVLGSMGLTVSEINYLKERGVIGSTPGGEKEHQPGDLIESRFAAGVYSELDSDYRQVLDSARPPDEGSRP